MIKEKDFKKLEQDLIAKKGKIDAALFQKEVLALNEMAIRLQQEKQQRSWQEEKIGDIPALEMNIKRIDETTVSEATVTVRSLGRLIWGEWLDDEIINYIIHTRARDIFDGRAGPNGESTPKSAVFSTLFFPALQNHLFKPNVNAAACITTLEKYLRSAAKTVPIGYQR